MVACTGPVLGNLRWRHASLKINNRNWKFNYYVCISNSVPVIPLLLNHGWRIK